MLFDTLILQCKVLVLTAFGYYTLTSKIPQVGSLMLSLTLIILTGWGGAFLIKASIF